MDTAELRRALRGAAAPELLARIELVVAADPDSPFSRAVSALFGLARGTKGAPLQRRKDLASVHLRQRRPKDPDIPSDSPLAGKAQARAISRLLEELALLLAGTSPPVRAGAEGYRGVADDLTIELWDDGSVREVRNHNHVVAEGETLEIVVITLSDLSNLESWSHAASFRPGENVRDLRVKASMPDSLVVMCLLAVPLHDGEKGAIGFDSQFAKGWYPWKRWTVTNSRDREYLEMSLRIPPGLEIEVRTIEMDREPGWDAFDQGAEDLAISKHGVARHRFPAYQAGQTRGFVWRVKACP